jgi:uncharacterized protein YecE (DUF72 family)
MAETTTNEQLSQQSPRHQVGCADLPSGMNRGKYFEKLGLLEVATFATSAPSRKAVRGWREKSPSNARFSLLASAELIGPKSFPVDEESKVCTAKLVDASAVLSAEAVVYKTPASFSPSAANQDRMRRYFNEIASTEAFGSTLRVWEPDGLWEPEGIAKIAEELGLRVAIDPLAQDPLEEYQSFVAEQMARGKAYLRIHGLGISRRRFDPYQLEMLAEMLQEVDQAWVVFAHPGKYPDALAMARAVGEYIQD